MKAQHLHPAHNTHHEHIVTPFDQRNQSHNDNTTQNNSNAHHTATTHDQPNVGPSCNQLVQRTRVSQRSCDINPQTRHGHLHQRSRCRRSLFKAGTLSLHDRVNAAQQRRQRSRANRMRIRLVPLQEHNQRNVTCRPHRTAIKCVPKQVFHHCGPCQIHA